jgi:hypothetical protein
MTLSHACGTGLNGDLFAMLDETLQVSAYGVFHYRAGFLQCVAFGNEPRQHRDGHYVAALGSRFEHGGVVLFSHAVASMMYSCWRTPSFLL